MSFFRKRQEQVAVRSTQNSKPDQAPANPAPVTDVQGPQIPPQLERSLNNLTKKVQQCMDRLDVIEHRLDDMAEATMNIPSHSDVMEVRMHSAKLAAELARATVELRGEIGMASDEARRAARVARSSVEEEPPISLPVDVDLTTTTAVNLRKVEDDDENTGNKDDKGWSASA